MAKANYYCPVEVTLEVIGGKWKCVILWWLRRGPKRFGELKQLIPDISQQVLTQQLRELEEDGLVRREAFREAPPRVEYSLTAYGATVRPITEIMCDWGRTHLPEHPYTFKKLEGLQILIVANDALLRERLQQQLAASGAQVFATETAIASSASNQTLNVVIVDTDSIGMDGDTLIQQIETERSNHESFVAIALTPNDIELGSLQRFQLHLTKPIENAELEAAIARLTGQFE